VVNETAGHFDWVGTGVRLCVSGGDSARSGSLSVDLTGAGERFAVLSRKAALTDAPAVLVSDFFAAQGRQTYNLTAVAAGDIITLVKTSEAKLVTLHGLSLDGPVGVAPLPPPPARRIDVYGDSDSAAYGVDGNGSRVAECILQQHQVHGVQLDGVTCARLRCSATRRWLAGRTCGHRITRSLPCSKQFQFHPALPF
jgi:hypothetical protein